MEALFWTLAIFAAVAGILWPLAWLADKLEEADRVRFR